MAIKRLKLMADFETTTDPADCRVWAGCAVDIEALQVVHIGNDLDSFMEYLSNKNTVCYFHNLKFDGQFIISHLLKMNYKQYDGKKSMEPKSFNALVSELGSWYSIQIKTNNKKNIVIYDSLKKLPFKVEQLAKQLGLPEEKGHIDYTKYREEGGKLSDTDKDYIRRDVQIVARALKEVCFGKGLYDITIGTDCMRYYKSITPNFDKIFPEISTEIDEYLRHAYKGGYCYVNPRFQGKLIKQPGQTYDYNSMYPSVMHSKLGYYYPVGEPEYFKGDYIENGNKRKPLYIQHFYASFKLKPGHVPTVQIKKSMYYSEHEYIEESQALEELYMTNVDLDMFFAQYDVYEYQAIDGYCFARQRGMFDKYIDYWYKYKEEATINKDKVGRLLAKLMLNNLYGKFGTGLDATTQDFYLSDDGILRHRNNYKTKKGVYIPVACFITAYARYELISAIQSEFDNFCYCDTDSIHIIGSHEPNLLIDDSALGHWKKECVWSQAKFLRQKTYAEKVLNPVTLKCEWDYKACGAPDEVKENIKDINDFKINAEFPGKKIVKRVPGGIVLIESTFIIRDI